MIAIFSAGLIGIFAPLDEGGGDAGVSVGRVIMIYISARWRSRGYRLTFPSRAKTAKIGLMRLPLGKSKYCGPRTLLSKTLTSTAGVTASLAIFPERRKLKRAVTSDVVGLASTIRIETCTLITVLNFFLEFQRASFSFTIVVHQRADVHRQH